MNYSGTKFIIYVTFIAIILILGIPTYNKVNANHKNRVYLTQKEKFKTKANQCWNDNICTDTKIYLKDLYNNNYLDPLIDPNTKKEFNENSYVEKENEEVIVKLFT